MAPRVMTSPISVSGTQNAPVPSEDGTGARCSLQPMVATSRYRCRYYAKPRRSSTVIARLRRPCPSFLNRSMTSARRQLPRIEDLKNPRYRAFQCARLSSIDSLDAAAQLLECHTHIRIFVAQCDRQRRGSGAACCRPRVLSLHMRSSRSRNRSSRLVSRAPKSPRATSENGSIKSTTGFTRGKVVYVPHAAHHSQKLPVLVSGLNT